MLNCAARSSSRCSFGKALDSQKLRHRNRLPSAAWLRRSKRGSERSHLRASNPCLNCHWVPLIAIAAISPWLFYCCLSRSHVDIRKLSSQQVLIVDLRADLDKSDTHWEITKMETNVRCRCRLKTIKSERKKKRATKIVTNSGGYPSKVNLLRSIGVSLWNSNSSDTCLWLSMRLRLSGFHVKSMFDRFSLVLNCINSISSRCRARGPSVRLKQRGQARGNREVKALWLITDPGRWKIVVASNFRQLQ